MNFNEQVYTLVRHIPRGKVLTYGRVAALLGVPHGARAVGWAMRQLRGGSDVPWQRVINASGGISTHYLDESGAVTQRRLLEAEGIQFDESGHVKLHGPDGVLWTPSPWEVQDILENASDG
jgi:methylated-DNA-protein-cysteine methyltransferase-like protein